MSKSIPDQSLAFTCSSCGHSAPKMPRCGRCKIVHYCNKTCQQSHFGEHKLFCKAHKTVKSATSSGGSDGLHHFDIVGVHGIGGIRNSVGEFVATTLEDPEVAAWEGSKTSFDELKIPRMCDILEGLGKPVPPNFMGEQQKMDYHAWCISKDGLIFDYDDKSLSRISDNGTLDIIRKPFPLLLHSQIKEWCEENSEPVPSLSQLGARLGGIEMAKAFLHSQIKTIPLGHCLARAKFLHRMDPVQYPTIVFGLLGFKHDDGRIYWEYG